MVVLAASICTRGGKPIISRQFRDMSRSRVEALLSSFPKLLSSNSQHTSVETESVRYVYQPLEDLYMILITNKNSNILQDIDTLHLFTRIVTDICSSAGANASAAAAAAAAAAQGGAYGTYGMYAGLGGGLMYGAGKVDERQVLRLSFELLGAFDEVIALGYRENVNLMQIKNILEMESHEEKIQDIIERNKEQEAKEELKRRAKQLEMQRREATRRGIPASNFGAQMSSSGGFGAGGAGMAGAGSAAAVHRENLSAAAAGTDGVVVGGAAAGGRGLNGKPFKGKGMQLGKKKSSAAPALGDAVAAAAAASAGAAMELDQQQPAAVDSGSAPRAAAAAQSTTATHTPASAAAQSDPSSILPPMEKQPVHILIKERVTLAADRDGGVKNLEIKGDLEVRITDASLGKLQLSLIDTTSSGAPKAEEMNWKTHPHVDKARWGSEKIIALKDANKSFPINQSLGVLRWRNTAIAKDESLLPIAITCWPSPSADGGAEVTIEFNTDALEATSPGSSLRDVRLVIPLPPSLSGEEEVTIGEVSQGEANVAEDADVLLWDLGSEVAAGESGNLEFTVKSGVQGEDVSAFFPVQVDFWSETTIGKVQVGKIVSAETSSDVVFSQQSILSPESYLVG